MHLLAGREIVDAMARPIWRPSQAWRSRSWLDHALFAAPSVAFVLLAVMAQALAAPGAVGLVLTAMILAANVALALSSHASASAGRARGVFAWLERREGAALLARPKPPEDRRSRAPGAVEASPGP